MDLKNIVHFEKFDLIFFISKHCPIDSTLSGSTNKFDGWNQNRDLNREKKNSV